MTISQATGQRGKADVHSNLKPDPEPCACGCGVVSQPRVRAWRDGLYHARRCVCHRCMAPRYKQRASARERRIAKDIGGTRSALSGVLSGTDIESDVCEVEETASEAVVRGIRRWWESKGVQRKVARLFARYTSTPKAIVLTWDLRKRLVVMRYEDWRSLCRMASEEADDAQRR